MQPNAATLTLNIGTATVLDDLKNTAVAFQLAFAFMGTLVYNSFAEPVTRRAAWVNIAVGMAVAMSLGPFTLDLLLWKFPDFPVTRGVSYGLAFLLGCFATVLIPAVSQIIKKAKVPGDA